MSDQVNQLAQLIRTVDGGHSLGAGALAEALHAAGVRVVRSQDDDQRCPRCGNRYDGDNWCMPIACERER